MVVAAAAAAFLLASVSKPSASGHDVVACAFLVPYRDAAAVVPVQVNPSIPCAFVGQVVDLFA